MNNTKKLKKILFDKAAMSYENKKDIANPKGNE